MEKNLKSNTHAQLNHCTIHLKPTQHCKSTTAHAHAQSRPTPQPHGLTSQAPLSMEFSRQEYLSLKKKKKERKRERDFCMCFPEISRLEEREEFGLKYGNDRINCYRQYL